MTCFVVDLLQRVAMSISFFMDFRFGSSNEIIRFNIVIRLNHVYRYAVNLEYLEF